MAHYETAVNADGTVKRSVVLADDGEIRLHTSTRKDGKEELRVCLRSFKGFPFVDIRTWFVGQDGEWHPGKGTTVKVRELLDVANALEEAATRIKRDGMMPVRGRE